MLIKLDQCQLTFEALRVTRGEAVGAEGLVLAVPAVRAAVAHKRRVDAQRLRPAEEGGAQVAAGDVLGVGRAAQRRRRQQRQRQQRQRRGGHRGRHPRRGAKESGLQSWPDIAEKGMLNFFRSL